MKAEIRDDEIIVDAFTGKLDAVKTTTTRFYTLRFVAAYLLILVTCVSS